MNDIPVVAESTIHARRCYGCDSTFVVHHLAFKGNGDTRVGVSWCNQCAAIVLRFLEERVLRAKEAGHE